MQVRVVALVAALVALAPGARAEDSSSAQGIVASVESAQGRIARLLRAARAQSAGTQARCADDGLSRVNAALRYARIDAREWSAARARNDPDGARRAMLRLRAESDAAKRASTQVDTCFELDRSADDRTEVRVIVDPG